MVTLVVSGSCKKCSKCTLGLDPNRSYRSQYLWNVTDQNLHSYKEFLLKGGVSVCYPEIIIKGVVFFPYNSLNVWSKFMVVGGGGGANPAASPGVTTPVSELPWLRLRLSDQTGQEKSFLVETTFSHGEKHENCWRKKTLISVLRSIASHLQSPPHEGWVGFD